MNNQEIFNRVVAYARTMEKPAITKINGVTSCMYRSDNGPCLIGSLIKDEFYKGDLEALNASNYLVISALHRSGIETDESQDSFLNNLQTCHDFASNAVDNNHHVGFDGTCDPVEVEELLPFNQQLMINLRVFADKYKLSMPE